MSTTSVPMNCCPICLLFPYHRPEACGLVKRVTYGPDGQVVSIEKFDQTMCVTLAVHTTIGEDKP